ncbi:histone deacetylase family protein [Spiribacter halobius]|uniref:Histone deacetylase n=1 Tax=Sediminicurvatus halobius TaxID=2182432 RepID=A0A2U2MZ43_9GAMM|nr:histone deacetylase [Spiribacter halobius]PWG62150.1 histone deacetylase [Spiribacter halobius]UEX77164.1 histone deacetylase [Spiribacter halobius]
MLHCVHHPGYTIPLPPGHPFPMEKFRVLREQLSGLPAHWHEPGPAREEDLARVHAPAYLEAFREGTIDERAQRRTGFRWSPALYRRTLLETGGTVLTAALALEHGLACNTAGGTHHAFAGHGSGYCLINDLAVAACWALAEGGARRVLIVDLDVHQGDGTAVLLADEPRAFTFSMHCAENFPARKQRSDRDRALRRGTGDEAYLDALEAELPALLADPAPDLVLYDAGADVHADDRLGHLRLSDDGLSRRDACVLGACRQRGIPVAAVIGGGYDRDIPTLARRHARLHHAAAQVTGCAVAMVN